MSKLHKIQTALLIIAIMMVMPFSVYAVDGQRKISQTPSTTFPIIINQPGSYVLTSNLVVTDPNTTAIEITDSHITLNLNGHMIRGPNAGGTGDGIFSEDGYNLTIKNGSIWGFGGRGIFLTSTSPEHLLEAGHYVKDVQTFLNGSHGIDIRGGGIINCTANRNNSRGISAIYSTITNCTTNRNGGDGIHASSSTFTNCTTNGNTNDGIFAIDSTVTHCTANGNGGNGIYASTSTITNCLVYGNSSNGIDAGNSTITNCTTHYNTSDGIKGYQNCRIEGNNMRHNGTLGTGYGLNITGDNNYVVKNVAKDNTSGNFLNSGINNVMPLTGDNANYWFP
jgi:hypothetical protein